MNNFATTKKFLITNFDCTSSDISRVLLYIGVSSCGIQFSFWLVACFSECIWIIYMYIVLTCISFKLGISLDCSNSLEPKVDSILLMIVRWSESEQLNMCWKSRMIISFTCSSRNDFMSSIIEKSSDPYNPCKSLYWASPLGRASNFPTLERKLRTLILIAFENLRIDFKVVFWWTYLRFYFQFDQDKSCHISSVIPADESS